MAEVSENFKFVDDLQQALRESLALFPVSELKSEQKPSRRLWEGEIFSDSYRRGLHCPNKPYFTLIGQTSTKIFWHQSDARTTATLWN